MAIVHGAALRKWARRSLLLAAILVAPSAYSEVVSQPPEEPGTLLGNYLSGRLARGDHDTLAAAGFYAKALASDPDTRALMDAVIEEAYAVARAEGVRIPWSDAAGYRDLFYGRLVPSTAGHRSSMLQDIERGRRTEIAAINGQVVARGQRRGVPTPTNAVLARLVQARERRVPEARWNR